MYRTAAAKTLDNSADTGRLPALGRTPLQLSLIIVFGLLAYSNSLNVPFLFDDEPYILNNPFIRDISNLTGPQTADGLKLGYNATLSTRYLVYLTFALNYSIHGLDPRGYHALNILIHIINALLVYLLIRLSFKTPFLRESKVEPYSGYVALFTSLVFVSHPIQTEAVTYISQRFTSMCAMFYLASMASYAASRLSKRSKRSYALYGLSIVFAIAAMKSKEIAFTLPIAIGLYEFSFFGGAGKRRLLQLVPLFLTMLIIPFSLMDFSRPLGEAFEGATKVAGSVSRADYLLTQFTVVATYLRLLFLPMNQNLDYDYPLYGSFFEPKVLMSFIFLLALVGLAAYLYMRSRRGEPALRLIGFGILWFFLALSVESSLVPLQNLIFEHRVYLPSSGAFIAGVCAGALYDRRSTDGRPGLAALVLLVAFPALLAACTYARNSRWRDALSLWQDVVSKSPANDRAHYNLANSYNAAGLIDNAIVHYKTAVELNPDNVLAHNNLGIAYDRTDRDIEAIAHYRSALMLNPFMTEARNNLGVLYAKLGRHDEALAEYKEALRINPGYAKAYNNLGTLYEKLGRHDDAMNEFEEALGIDPGDPSAHFNIALIYEGRGLHEKAVERYQAAIGLDPGYTQARNNLGVLYKKLGRFEDAIVQYEEALRTDPGYAAAHYNMAIALERLGRLERAVEEYLAAIGIDPLQAGARNNLGILYFRMGRHEEAMEEFSVAAGLEPQNEEFRRNLKTARKMLGKGDGPAGPAPVQSDHISRAQAQ